MPSLQKLRWENQEFRVSLGHKILSQTTTECVQAPLESTLVHTPLGKVSDQPIIV